MLDIFVPCFSRSSSTLALRMCDRQCRMPAVRVFLHVRGLWAVLVDDRRESESGADGIENGFQPDADDGIRGLILLPRQSELCFEEQTERFSMDY